jgi:galactose mutarotase-like enzyme
MNDSTASHTEPPSSTPSPRRCRVTRIRLRGGKSEGVDVVEIDNGRLRVALLPQRGLGLWKAWLDGVEFGWKSPVRGPVHPAWVPISDPLGCGWLEGFDELLCRCGLASNGLPEFDAEGRLAFPQHGRIANLPSEALEIHHDESTGAVRLTGIVHETRFHFQKLALRSTLVMRPDEPALEIHDEVMNLSETPATAQLLYHINLGLPTFGPGSIVSAPVDVLVPRDAQAAPGIDTWNRLAAPSAAFKEECFYGQLNAHASGQTMALLKDAEGTRGVSVRMDKTQLPCFVLWKNTVAEQDGYVVGLEPSTNYPNRHSFEADQGRVLRLAPRESRRFDLRLAFHDDRAAIEAVEAEIAQMQGSRTASIGREPTSDWCG